MNKRTRIIATAGTAALVVLGVGIGVVVAGDDEDDGTDTASSTASSSTTTTTSTTVSVTSTTLLQQPPPPNGTPVDGAGALLSAPPPPVTQSTEPPGADCNALGDPGWTVKACGRASMAGGERVWLVEHKPVPASATEAWRAFVLQWSEGKGAWLVDLEYKDDDASVVFDINVLEADLTGDGKPELVFGYRFSGSGSILGYDLVASAPGKAPAIAVHRELSHGAALVADGVITDYDAKYPNNEPNCCPAYVQQSTVSHQGGAWYVTRVAQVAAAGAGNL